MSPDPMDMMGPGGQTAAPDDMANQPAAPAPEETPQTGENEDQGEPTSLFLTPDMLPPGHQCKAGDILKFKVLNPSDADGHIEVVYDSGYDDEGGGEESYEQGFKNYMSARNSGAGSPEDDGTGNSGAAY